MPKTKPISIRSMGLQEYLDSTALAHNGQGYKEFCFYIKHRVPHSAIGRMFNIGNRRTIGKWVDIYKEEQENEQEN